MDRKKKEAISFIGLTLSILSLVSLVVLSSRFSLSINTIGLCVLASTIAFMISVIGIFHYSSSGWEVEGSTLEWILAAIISPFTALFLYLFGGRRRERE